MSFLRNAGRTAATLMAGVGEVATAPMVVGQAAQQAVQGGYTVRIKGARACFGPFCVEAPAVTLTPTSRSIR